MASGGYCCSLRILRRLARFGDLQDDRGYGQRARQIIARTESRYLGSATIISVRRWLTLFAAHPELRFEEQYVTLGVHCATFLTFL